MSEQTPRGTVADLAALARAKGGEEDADGWIEWSGGVNPVGSHVVAVKYRNGEIEVQDGRRFGWDHWHDEVSGLGGYDIIAYRLAALQEPGHG